MPDIDAAPPTTRTTEDNRPPPLIPFIDDPAARPPFARLFSEILAPLARNYNLLPDAALRLFADELGENLPLSAPALADIMVDMAPSLDQVVTLPPGTAFATSSSEGANPVVFSTLAERVLESACLLTAGILPTSADTKGTAQFVPIAHDLPVETAHCVLFVLSRPLPGMTCLVTLPTDIPDSASMHWEAWQSGEWVSCGTSLSAAPKSAEFAVPVPPSHSPYDFPATGEHPPAPGAGLLRCSADSPFTLLGEAGVRCRGSVTAVQGELVHDEILGRSDGTPAQQFPLRQPISTTYLRPLVESVQDAHVERWTMVDSFAASGPLDRHFMVNAATSRIAFSPDPQRGGTPPPGATLRIPSYHCGGGAAGNVPGRSISILQTPRPEITGVFNPYAAIGGTEPRDTHRSYTARRRPVLLTGASATAQECEDLALSSGLGIARALCAPTAAGSQAAAVKLYVLPTAQPDTLGRLTEDQLTPSPDAVDAIRRDLGPRLPTGADIIVTRFPLMEISTAVTVRAEQWASPQERKTLARDACLALYRYFSPLPGAGPSGDGWPVGQSAQNSDIHRALLDVPNIDGVTRAELRGPSAVPPHSLVYSGHHTVTCITFDGQTDYDATFRG
ncbi:putative baseplate assembly protein [Streptomyces sp. FIT100]|uniref:putative baseplate assembly protein n=1 Tax=Streptomyces sp. FIT100 TaxID=2837956 RepID=UPI0021CA9DBF|nr:putative baseplate assembly protein [Streptomyces sp. FIT100]UUN30796.1 putative baseplate assembly protein [Streptomyces sp. FIT100]